jgi:hypothetical protein
MEEIVKTWLDKWCLPKARKKTRASHS